MAYQVNKLSAHEEKERERNKDFDDWETVNSIKVLD